MQQPFANCKYQICDLPGQCVSEGACHHPKEPAPAQGVTVTGDLPIEVIDCRVEQSEQQARREAWEAATDKPTLEPDGPKLQKPAKVGGAIFGCGVSERLVIEAAQRNYAYNDEDAKLTPDERQQRERYRRELWDSIHGSPQSSPAEPVSATPMTLEVVHLLKALSKPETNYYLYDDGYCKSQKLADEAAKGLAQVEQLLRELAEAKLERDAAQRAAYENMHIYQTAEASAAELQSELEGFKVGHEEDEAHILEQDATIKTLQAKLDAETKRADGAHNAAIDKCYQISIDWDQLTYDEFRDKYSPKFHRSLAILALKSDECPKTTP